MVVHTPNSERRIQLKKDVRSLWEQLSLMEISLQRAGSMRKLHQSETASRLNVVTYRKSQLQHIKKVLELDDTRDRRQKSELPEAAKLSPLEFSTVAEYLEGHKKMTRQTLRTLKNIHPWIEAAAKGQIPLLTIFHLAKLKRWRSKLQGQLWQIKLDIQDHKKLLRVLIDLLQSKPMEGVQTTTVRQAANAFAKVSHQVESIGTLKKQIPRKKNEIKRMKDWLTQVRHSIRSQALSPSPDLDSLQAINDKLEIFGVDKLHRSFERASLARMYLNSFEKRFSRDKQEGVVYES